MTAFKGLGTYGNAVGVVTPLDHKLADAGLITKASGNLIRPGLFWGGTATIVSGTAGMAYSVIAYTCATTRGVTSGAVLGGNDGVLSVSTTAAPGSNSRYDVVYHWHREYSLDGVDSNPVIGVIQGTAAASPTVPSLAAFPGAIALATILVPAGVTATNTGTTITQTAPFTSVANAPFPVRTIGELPTGYAQGTLAYALDSGVTFQYYAVFNSTTNPAGAKTAGWYPAPGSDVFFHTDRANAITSPVNATAGIGAGGSLLGSPTYQSQFFSFTTGGLISPLFEGRYSIRASAQWTASASGGVVQMYVTKNQTTVAAAGNLAGEDGNGGNPASITLKAIVDSVPLLTTDVLRMVNNAISGSIWTVGGNNTPAAAQLDIRWQGVIHA